MAQKPKTGKNRKSRVRKASAYKSFRLSKRIKPASQKPLPGVITLYKSAYGPLRRHKRLFLGIIAIHLVLTVIFVSGIASSLDFVEVKNSFKEAFGNDLGGFSSALALFAYVLSSGSGSSDTSSNYQIFISLLTSLAIIWSVRQVLAGEKIGVRQAFYQGVYPLVPFMLVLVVIGLQLIPLLIGNFLLSTVLNNGLAITVLEKTFWWLIFILLALLSLYMVLSSIFALYISTLPDMTPLKALRSARGLVLHRRGSVALRLLGLPVILLAIYVAVLIPFIFILPILVVPLFLVLGSFTLYFTHAYIYNLYRALL